MKKSTGIVLYLIGLVWLIITFLLSSLPVVARIGKDILGGNYLIILPIVLLLTLGLPGWILIITSLIKSEIKTWLKGGFLGGALGNFHIIFYWALYYILPKSITKPWKFNLLLYGIQGRIKITLLFILLFFIIGAIIGLIVQKVRE